MAWAYYNEYDEFAAAWLRELIRQGYIADGLVDERSITEVQPDDLKEFSQCHFFAGIGGWSLAARMAGVPDDFPLWTGSCPCQAFSIAGKKKGLDDERHLWPTFYRLIDSCRPPVVVGEQVEAAIRFGWLDVVQDDLERSGYSVGAAGLPASCVGAPHIRQRLYWGGVLGWATPRVFDSKDRPSYHYMIRKDGKTRDDRITLQALLATTPWRTPACTDGEGGIPTEAIVSPSTFTSMDKNAYKAIRSFGTETARSSTEQTQSTQPCGTPQNSDSARTERLVQLNPSLSRWLMGFPPEWDVCAVTAMLLSHNLRRSFLKSYSPAPTFSEWKRGIE